ncbi:MAG: hypothetical protein R3Y51_01325 [Rikenellaceae bacterium]
MGLFSNLFGKKNTGEEAKNDVQTNVEEFMSLIRIYYQASIIAHVGITNLSIVPEFAMYKRMMRIPTVGGKVGIAEKSHVRKSMMADYGMNETFFKEIDSSIRRNCKGMRDIQGYFFAFGNFTNDLMTYLSSQLQWRLQFSMIFKGMVRPTVSSAIKKLLTKEYWKDETTTRSVYGIRASKQALGYSEAWMTEFVCQILYMSRKDARDMRSRKKKKK